MSSFIVTYQSLLETVADRIGAVQEKSVNKLWISIANKLSDGTVIIVDEAQKFAFDAIDTLRGFSDYFKNKNLGTVGIVCIGNETFRDQFSGKSGKGKEQVWNRFVERPKYETKSILYSDIKLMFLYGVAQSPKEDIRSAVNLYTKVYNTHNGNCTLEMLDKQAKRMQIDLSYTKEKSINFKNIGEDFSSLP